MANTMHYGNMQEPDPEQGHEELKQQAREKDLAAYPFIEPYIDLVEYNVKMNSVATDYSGLPPEVLAMMREAKARKTKE